MNEIDVLEKNLKIPINELKFNKKDVDLILKDKTIAKIGFLKNKDQIIFDYSEELLQNINWNLIVELEREIFRTILEKEIRTQNFKIEADEFSSIKIFNEEGVLILIAECEYINKQWHLSEDISFELIKKENEIKHLKNQMGQQSFQVQQYNYLEHQNKMIDKVIDKGGEMFFKWMDNQSKNAEREIELSNEFEKEELDVVNDLDKRDKVFKGGIVVLCLLLMGILSYFDKASSVLPLIGVIIGLVLQSDSISKYFTGSAKKRKSNVEEE